ncbi:sulfite exporter TauE/SafE family protein [Bdellovibrionota bacterium FG-1]
MTLFAGLLLMIFGTLIGTLGTVIGVGSGWIHVPLLMMFFDFSPQDAIGTSLSIIALNTMAGSFLYAAQRRIDFEFAKRLALAALPGAILGPFIVRHYTSDGFKLVFSVFLLFLAYYLYSMRDWVFKMANLMQKDAMTITTAKGEKIEYTTNIEIGIIGTFIIGFLANLLGIGGGVIHVPFLITMLRVPPHVAVATSHFILFISSFIGTVIFAFMGHVKLDFMMTMGIGTIFGAIIGAAISSKTSEKKIRSLLAIVVSLVALHMIYSSIMR